VPGVIALFGAFMIMVIILAVLALIVVKALAGRRGALHRRHHPHRAVHGRLFALHPSGPHRRSVGHRLRAADAGHHRRPVCAGTCRAGPMFTFTASS
jgi:hypothetical protein